MEKTRIAVVSTDGIHVDEHFGRATRFLIYDPEENMTLVANRVIEPLSVNDPQHSFDAERFNRIAERLKDCRRVYMTRIGEVPAAKLKALGIEPEIYKGAIAHIPGLGTDR
jgi:predicted Fe-Mo cluster-binding NifX family protein